MEPEQERNQDEAEIDRAEEPDDHVDDHERLLAKPRTKAAIWSFFGFLPSAEDKDKIDNLDKPLCRKCREPVPIKHSATSNLYTHLRYHHKELYETVKGNASSSSSSSSSQPTIAAAFDKVKPLDTKSKEHKSLTDSITRCLARDMLPIRTVEKPGFKAMVSRFNPKYQLPSRSYFSRVAIPYLYTTTRESVQRSIKEDMVFFASTTDLWSSAAMEPYLSFSVHFITPSWELQTCCLQSQFMPQNHTGANIKACLQEVLLRWNLPEAQMVALTTDSGSNIKLACQLAHWVRVSCFGHNLDLAVKKGLEDRRVDRVVAVCRKIVTAFNQSWKRQRDMATIQEEKNLPLHKLKGDCATRWGSTSSMMERIYEQQEAVRIVLAGDRKVSHLILTWQDVDVIDSVLAVLRPLQQLTDLLSGEKYVTVSVVSRYLTTFTLKY